jgi:hypothetical protein
VLTSGFPLVCVVSSAFFGVAGVCVLLTMGWPHTDWTYFALSATETFYAPFVELLELMYQALGFLRGHKLEVERNLSWSGCLDGGFGCHVARTLRLPDTFDDMLYLT